MKIVMTGGGTSGHVTPNIALFEPLKKAGFNIYYIGSVGGIEQTLVEAENIPFYGIQAGKLRRYMDMQNIKDIAKIAKGYHQSVKLLKNIRPDVVFSKGGFVTCPVVWAAKRLGIPVVLHESDITPGLANKLSLPYAKKICCAFPETKEHLPENKSVYTGLPVRASLFNGNRDAGLSLCQFDGSKPILTVIGGSQGSEFINNNIRKNLASLLQTFDICHICGKNNRDDELINQHGYVQFEYLNQELTDVFAATDFFISRAGATVIFEILALKKPALLIPLSKRASRGDQILNAKSFERQGYTLTLEEEEIQGDEFLDAVKKLYESKDVLIKNQSEADLVKSTSAVIEVILSAIK